MSNNKDTLTGRRPAETYPGLLKLGSTYMTSSGASAGDADVSFIRLDDKARAIQDGEGNSSPLWLSATKLWLHGFEFTQPTETDQIPKYEVIESNGSVTRRLTWVKRANLIDTGDIRDPSGKFYSEANFSRSFSTKTTDNLVEGTRNKYFTVTAARNAVSSAGGKLVYDASTGRFSIGTYYTGDVLESSNLYWTQARFDEAFRAKSTSDLREGTNQYYTDTKARAAIRVTGGGTYDANTGVINIPQVAASAAALSGGGAGQVPYQANATTTNFSPRFRWDNAAKKLLLGDATNSAFVSGVGGTSTKTTLTIDSGASSLGSDLVLVGGATTGANPAGDVAVTAGSSVSGLGGSVVISSGTGQAGGSVVFKTGVTTSTEAMRITPSGAISLGVGGASTGTANQYLASAGPNSAPVWKSLPTRVAEAQTADWLAGGRVGAIPYQTAVGRTGFTDALWSAGQLKFDNADFTLTSSGNLLLAPQTALTISPLSTAANSNINLRVNGTASKIGLYGASTEVLAVLSNGTLTLGGVMGNTNQVPMVMADGTTKYKAITTSEVAEGSRLYWTQARFNTAFAAKNTDGLVEGTTNKYWNQTLFDDALAGKTTTDVAEGTRLYWTQARFNTAFAAKNTDGLAEGTTNKYWSQTLFNNAFAGKTTTNLIEGTNLYWTQSRFNSALAGKTTTDVAEGTNLYWTQARFNTAFAAKNTDGLVEGATNKYFTNARSRSAISVSGALSYNSSTGVISYNLPSALDGQLLYAAGNNTRQFTPGPLVTTGTFVSDDAALEFAKNQVTPQSQIIGKWKAFSHNNTATQPALPAEMTAWEYDSATNSIRNTTNSSSYIGLVSDKTYMDYDHEVRIKSTNTDDDVIGIVLAYVVENGVEHTLSATRSCGGFNTPWVVSYNFNQSTRWLMKSDGDTVKWSNGAYGADTTAAGYTGSPGWSTFTIGTKIKVTRRGNLYTVITTDLDSPDYIAGSSFTIDASSDPRLNKFMGRVSIGFSALSQQYSYWEQLSFVDLTPIYDIRSGQKWVRGASGWSVDATQNLSQSIGTGRLVLDSVSGGLFYVADSSTILPIGKKEKASDAIADFTMVHSASVTLNANASTTLTYATYMGNNAMLFDKTTVKPEVLIMETSGTMNNFYVSAIATANFGVNVSGDVRVHNPTTEARTYLVRVYAKKV